MIWPKSWQNCNKLNYFSLEKADSEKMPAFFAILYYTRAMNYCQHKEEDTMVAIEIIQELTHKRAAAYDGDKVIGTCTFVPEGKVWTLDHTIVDPNYGGQGIAGQLVYSVAEMARQQQAKIIPQCSYAAGVFKRKKEYEDVLYKEE